ncbi:hypothetical protein ACFZAE_16050 [Streptomyces scabiei]|uniref:hypothetical protein n=1 Tax=Streptomyces scabiei TaxID=1930 RepID=UPI0036E34F68
MIRRRVAHLHSSPWGRLYTACTLLTVAAGGWSTVRTFTSSGQDDDVTDHLFTASVAMCLVGFLLLGLHERHLRARRGEAEPLDVRRVVADLRSLPASANGKVALAFAALGAAGWAYAWVCVRWLGWDVPGVPDADGGELFVRAGTLSCVIGALFVGVHFKERR